MVRMKSRNEIAKLFVSLVSMSMVQVIYGLTAPSLVNDGFYKLINMEDGSVLTTTRRGPRPHEVITDYWQNLPTQHWKVKSKTQEGVPLQIIRNEQIRENEVTKEPNYETTPNANEFVPLDWNFMKDPSGRENTFVLHNGVGCLIGNGKGERIRISHCDESAPAPNELWRVELLFKIPKP